MLVDETMSHRIQEQVDSLLTSEAFWDCEETGRMTIIGDNHDI